MEIKNNSSRDGRLAEMIREKAALFLQRESSRISLITVTGVQLADAGKLAYILYTVMPVHKQPEAEDFLKRMRGEFRKYFMSEVRIGRVPTFDFKLDLGEKHRQKIDDLMNKL
ncbi:MAG: ribosome-binding factor A [bacterium]|jgi:ribosome-binding factor A